MKLETLLAKLASASVDHGASPSTAPTAAVAAILRELPGAGPELFFIVRAEKDGDPWSGHVAFPGGRREPEDASLLETAIRETREEVGFELSPKDVVARLPDISAVSRRLRAGGLVVTPFVFVVHEELAIRPNEEVAAALWVPLSRLVEGAGKNTFELEHDGKKYTLPYVYLEPGQHRLWGMTYGMLMSLLDAAK